MQGADRSADRKVQAHRSRRRRYAPKVQQQSEEPAAVARRGQAPDHQPRRCVAEAERAQSDLQAVQGKADGMQRQVDAPQKSFTEYRAQSDTKACSSWSTPPRSPAPQPPITRGDVRRRPGASSSPASGTTRRVFDACQPLPRGSRQRQQAKLSSSAMPTSPKVKFANAIGAFTKVIDNFAKSDDVESAMFKTARSSSTSATGARPDVLSGAYPALPQDPVQKRRQRANKRDHQTGQEQAACQS